MMMILIKLELGALGIAMLFVTMGCKKLVDIPPPDTEILRESIFEDDNTALAAVLGVYNKLVTSSGFNGGSLSITVTEGVYADELISYTSPGNSLTAYYLNNVDPTNSSVHALWSNCYNMIYSANAVIEGLKNSKAVSTNVRAQLTGEALFLRSFLHFYLVNLFGPVPYIRTTEYTANSKVSRMAVEDVYPKIINDLLEAKALLTNDYPSSDRVRINKGVATALLARAYLYNKDWINAEAQATEVITNIAQYSLLADLHNVFLKESSEVLWQLIPPYGYTNEGSIFILIAPPNLVALKNNVVNSFESGDLRKLNWIDSITSGSGFTKWYFPFKYKIKNIDNKAEYSVVLRLAEQYLIRAEARAEQNKLTGPASAAEDIDSIRHRAGLGNTPVTTKEGLLAAIVQERKVELLAEWGQRFFDLKRWGKLDAVLGPVKPNWNTTDALLPLPQSELLANPNLEQNPGY